MNKKPSKPSPKPVTPGKMEIRLGTLDMGAPYYLLYLNEHDFSLNELEEVGNQILSLVRAAHKAELARPTLTEEANGVSDD